MPKPKTVKAVSPVEAKLDKLTESVSQLVELLAAKPTIMATPFPAAAITASPAYSAPVSTGQVNQFPIPFEYRNAVDTILNKKFGLEISYPSDGVGFDFQVLVPKEYSNAGEPHWSTYGEDRRSKVIANAFGINGVREWLNLIYNNLPMETKNKVTFDRGQII